MADRLDDAVLNASCASRASRGGDGRTGSLNRQRLAMMTRTLSMIFRFEGALVFREMSVWSQSLRPSKRSGHHKTS